ncbi:MAG: 6-bladed beta-propeller [Sedimentisphaerales bacterium]|nr:6-bladed beta-propeller [Sedimentisphaerales bacterium]
MRSISFCISIVFLFTLFGDVRAQASSERQGDTLRYNVDAAWPKKPDRFKWGAMPGIAVDNQDHIYIFTRSQPTVQVYKADGTLVRAFYMEDAGGTHFIRIGPEGNIWTANIAEQVVRKYSPKGKLLLTLGEAGAAGTDEAHFDRPTDMAILASGDIFVCDGYGNRRIVHFDSKGKFINQWGQAGEGTGQFALPHSIVADSRKRLYVADRENARIQVFDTKGKVLAVWENIITPWGLCMTKKDELWVCGSSAVREGEGKWLVNPPADQIVMKLSLKGKVLKRVNLVMAWKAPGKPGELDLVHAIAVDSHGNLYLGDIQGKRAQKFSP